MDDHQRAAVLGEIATQAGIERASFLTDAARGFDAFLAANRQRIRDLGGLVLIDEEPEYLAITEEGTFLSRSRYQDASGEWVAETEEIEGAGGDRRRSTTRPTCTPPSPRRLASRLAWSRSPPPRRTSSRSPAWPRRWASSRSPSQMPARTRPGWIRSVSRRTRATPPDRSTTWPSPSRSAANVPRRASSSSSRSPPKASPPCSVTAWSWRTRTSACGTAPAAPSRPRSCPKRTTTACRPGRPSPARTTWCSSTTPRTSSATLPKPWPITTRASPPSSTMTR